MCLAGGRNGWGFQHNGERELGGWDEVQPGGDGGKEGGRNDLEEEDEEQEQQEGGILDYHYHFALDLAWRRAVKPLIAKIDQRTSD